LGSYGFSGQYEQDPAPEGGGILQTAWWRYYSMLPSVKDIDQGVISVDCAFKDLADSDYACMQAWWKIGANRYLVDQIRGKWAFPTLVANLRAFIRKHEECKARLIEDKANGSAVIQTLRDEITGLIAVDPKGGKIARAHAVSPQLEAGNFLLPEPRLQPWVSDFIQECAKFPKATNDDQVDCFTQAATYMDIRQFSTWMARINWL
jgi:predicted phage terminase large subunit-like protein